jgi:hypothetical protein
VIWKTASYRRAVENPCLIVGGFPAATVTKRCPARRTMRKWTGGTQRKTSRGGKGAVEKRATIATRREGTKSRNEGRESTWVRRETTRIKNSAEYRAVPLWVFQAMGKSTLSKR